MTSAAIYARFASARQAKDETIGSQLAALRDHAVCNRLEVPQEWVFADEGHSGATLVRPGLEALRDLAAQGCLDVVLVYSPDRLARKFAYQALMIEELARQLGTQMIHFVPRDNDVQRAEINRKTVIEWKASCPQADEYRQLAAAIDGNRNFIIPRPLAIESLEKLLIDFGLAEDAPNDAVVVA